MADKKSGLETMNSTSEGTVPSSASGWIHWIFRGSLLEVMGPNYPARDPAQADQPGLGSEVTVEAPTGQGE